MLNVPSILLPLSNKVHFDIIGYNGCFKWSVMHPNLVTLENIDSEADCSTSIRVRASPSISDTKTRQSTWINAEDKTTKKIIGCEIFFDNIHTLEIDTTTRKLFQDHIERIDVRGHDVSGNIFTSLEGLLFDWKIDSGNTRVLSRVPFKDSSIDISPTLLSLESQGLHSSAILVKGLRVGDVRVSASLQGTAIAISVVLSVHERLEIDPSNLYILPKQEYQFKLLSSNINNNQPQLIPMPNKLYTWKSSDPKVAMVDPKNGVLNPVALGEAIVSVEPEQAKNNIVRSFVFVVEPSHLAIEITPISDVGELTQFKNPKPQKDYLVHMRKYQMVVQLKEKNDNNIYLPEQVKFKVELPVGYFTIESQVGNRIVFVCNNEGMSFISAKLDSLSITQKVKIVSRVGVTPAAVILPYDSTVSHSFKLTASGGSQTNYNWTSSDSAVVSVSGGVVKSGKTGKAFITCRDTKDGNNFYNAEVLVSAPSSISFLPTPQQVPVGEEIQLYITSTAQNRAHFSNCGELPISIKQTNPSVFKLLDQITPSTTPSTCYSLRLKPLTVGSSTFTITLNQLNSSLLMLTHPNLSVTAQEVHLTVGSAYRIGFSGGPAPWPYQPLLHFAEMSSNDDGLLDIKAARYKSMDALGYWNIYTLKCLSEGEQNVLVQVGNIVHSTNPHPVVAKKEILVSCSHPSSLYIYPLIKTATQKENCAEAMKHILMNRGDKKIKDLPKEFDIRGDRTIEFELVVFDKLNRQYNNFSSFQIDWQSSNNDVLKIFPYYNEIAPTYAEISEFRYLRSLQFSDFSGSVSLTITATIQNSAFSLFFRGPMRISETFVFNVYPRLTVSPAESAVYYHKGDQIILTPHGGSGNIATKVTGAQSKVSVISEKEVAFTVVEPGEAKVVLQDVCVPTDTTEAVLHVSDVQFIKLHSPDAVQVGGQIHLVSLMFGKLPTPFTGKQLENIAVDFQMDNDKVLSIVRDPLIPTIVTVEGLSAGVSNIIAYTVTSDKKTLQSDPISIHVYQPFQLDPQQLELIPGTAFQLLWKGGPLLQEKVNFEVTNQNGGNTNVATVDPLSGLLTARQPGVARVTATAFNLLPSGERMEVGKSSIDLKVKYLDGIGISGLTHRLLVGNEIVLQITGSNKEPAFIFGNTDVDVKWEVTNVEIVELLPFFKGNSVDQEKSYNIRIRAVGEGTVVITATVIKAPYESKLMGMKDSLSVTVIEPLRLVTPPTILIAPRSQYQVKTNYDEDGHRSLSYELKGNANSVIVKVSKQGLISSSTNPGTVFLQVTDRDTTLINQTALVKVVVKPITGISLIPLDSMDYGLVVGNKAVYDIAIFDELGSPFDGYDGVVIDYSMNSINVVAVTITRNKDIVNARPQLTVSGLTPGNITIKITASSSETLGGNKDTNICSTYIILQVRNAITPEDFMVHVGGTIQFKTGFIDNSLYKKPWTSSDPSLLMLNSEDGTALGKKTGRVTVSFNAGLSTSTSGRIVKADKVAFGIHSLKFDSSNQINLRIPVQVMVGQEELLDLPAINNGLQLKCDIVNRRGVDMEVTSLKPSVDAPRHYCSVTIRFSDFSVLSNRYSAPEIQATIFSKESSLSLHTVMQLEYFPLFNIYTRNTALPPDQHGMPIVVVWISSHENTHPPLEVQYNHNLFSVVEITVDDVYSSEHFSGLYSSLNNSCTIYYLTHRSSGIKKFYKEEVTFSNKETNQNVSIYVSSTELYEERTPTRGASLFWNFISSLVLVSTVVAMVTMVAYCYKPFQAPPPPPAPVQPANVPPPASNKAPPSFSRGPPYYGTLPPYRAL
uniref:BIG2 domain-containing protein n=1 Tax=Arcella intermedia TaxID=1963864 RepID=A0A6B2KW74_9EUKA